MFRKVIKKQPYGRIIFEAGCWGYHATKGWRKIASNKFSKGYDKLMDFLARSK